MFPSSNQFQANQNPQYIQGAPLQNYSGPSTTQYNIPIKNVQMPNSQPQTYSFSNQPMIIQQTNSVPNQYPIQSQQQIFSANPSYQTANLGQQIPLQNTYSKPFQPQQIMPQAVPSNIPMTNFGTAIPSSVIQQQIMQGQSTIPITTFPINPTNPSGKFQPLPTFPSQIPQSVQGMPYNPPSNFGVKGPLDISKIEGKVVRGDPISYIETAQGKFMRESGMSDKDYFTKALGIKGTIVQIGDPKVVSTQVIGGGPAPIVQPARPNPNQGYNNPPLIVSNSSLPNTSSQVQEPNSTDSYRIPDPPPSSNENTDSNLYNQVEEPYTKKEEPPKKGGYFG